MYQDKQVMNTNRGKELRMILEEHRRRIIGEMQDKIRDVRAHGTAEPSHAEDAEADIQDDLELALLQMKAETLKRIDEALARLKGGTYGYCYECGEEIANRRLSALPFAVRCKDCEEIREAAARQRERGLAQQRGALVADLSA